MNYDPPYDPPDFDDDDEELQTELPVTPPTNMKLTIEVGLTEYSPNGLLELIARALLKDIGGRDRWAALLNKKLQTLADEQARELIQKEVNDVWAGSSEIDFRAIVQNAARDYMTAKVDNSGDPTRYNQDKRPTRLEWIVANLTKQAMDAAFKEAETEWKEQTKKAIRETLAETLAVRLAKTLPSPPELR